MSEYLPSIYREFTERYPDVAAAQGALAEAVRAHTGFDARTDRLLKFALALGAQSDGAVRSNVRKALAEGSSPDELRAVALAAITTCGFPTAIAGLRWIEEVLAAQDDAAGQE
ncbi:carboxymuconolactone decarboxylase family protein [Paenibacillus sp. TRM 82003]|uniref:carboxymuconolactone decarboxylase family protein n=1 Tax=Kineococcus sp. TRM81007 TaxID=2925831 RepID=UPI001F569EE6|nr:carboxymuconolactone decarboxylase family protein [Kineococcus sp. TRM81007]MCI2237509.1 carboxymuconolactone decarboxylase family protein [Kineococcus sp. TRM81007]MCI3919862.1 carboxymuconolactone decarboxylase family protein [Paenibacillus sp. TRM 82003]